MFEVDMLYISTMWFAGTYVLCRFYTDGTQASLEHAYTVVLSGWYMCCFDTCHTIYLLQVDVHRFL